jgi:hypothetical protein
MRDVTDVKEVKELLFAYFKLLHLVTAGWKCGTPRKQPGGTPLG